MEDNEQKPSFGLVAIHRITCGGRGMRLFESRVPSSTVIQLTIKTAKRRRDLSSTWVYGDTLVAQVLLTPAQFAELITTPNTGDGVPCTIEFHQGAGHIKHEPEPDESEQFRVDMSEHLDTVRAALADLKTKLGPKPQRPVREAFEALERELLANLPFVGTQFDKHMRKRMSDAKAEFDAFVTHAIHTTGLQALQAGNLPELPGTETEEPNQ